MEINFYEKAIENILTFLAVICIIFVMFAPFALYIGSKRAKLYEYSVKLNGYNYDNFMNFYNRNIKNKNEKAFILDLRSEFEEDNFLVWGLHDCGKHMLWCKNTDSFHYLRNTTYRQDFAIKSNNILVFCYIYYPQYYNLDNPNLKWIEVDDFARVPPPLLGSVSESFLYELIDITQEKSLIQVRFSPNTEYTTEGLETIINDTKNKLLSKFTETYL